MDSDISRVILAPFNHKHWDSPVLTSWNTVQTWQSGINILILIMTIITVSPILSVLWLNFCVWNLNTGGTYGLQWRQVQRKGAQWRHGTQPSLAVALCQLGSSGCDETQLNNDLTSSWLYGNKWKGCTNIVTRCAWCEVSECQCQFDGWHRGCLTLIIFGLHHTSVQSLPTTAACPMFCSITDR